MKLQSVNPHDQSIVGELDVSTQAEVQLAVKNAKKAYAGWSRLSVKERANYIEKYKNKIIDNREEIARLSSLEMGKPFQQSLDDIDAETTFLEYYINNASKFLADETVRNTEKEHYRVTYEPYGVCACIAPWNFPLSMANSGVIPALLAGNTIILKPSEYTTLSQKKIVDLLNEVGLPDGVANLVVGGGEVGKMLIDENIDLAWFTGSTKVGQEIYAKCGKKFIKALLEMGGSSPGIVFQDADLNVTLENLYWGRFLNCGQVCTAIKRLFVEKPIYDQVVRMFVEKLKTLKIGNPLKLDTDIGPLVSKKQLSLLQTQVKDAVDKGAKIIIGGKQPSDPTLKQGNYFEPTIITNVLPDMKIISEEVFGPVLPIISFETEEEAVVLANNTEYGLSAEVYTTDINKAERVAKQIRAGTVAINTDNFFVPECPFGGYKMSGVGREYGEIGMREFSQIKVIAVVRP